MSDPGTVPLSARTPRAINIQPEGGDTVVQTPGGPNPAAEMGHLDYTVNDAPYAALSQLGGDLAQVGEKMAEPEMADKGAQAVTRDPQTGELSVQLRTPLNDLDVAYNHAAQTAFAAQSEGDRRLALQQLAIQNIDNPGLFQDLATKYVKTQAGGQGVPTGLRTDLLTTGMQDVAEFTRNLTAQKQERDVRTNLASIKDNIDQGWNDIFALAHQGGTETPEFKAAVAKVQNQYGALRNPVFGIGQDQIEAEIRNNMGSAQGEAILGHAEQEAKANGVPAGIDLLNKAIWDPSLNLSQAQRFSFESRGRREMFENDAADRAAQTQLTQQVNGRLNDAAAAAEGTGNWQNVISPEEITSAYKSDPTKGLSIIAELNAKASLYSMRKGVANATPAQLAAMDLQLQPKATLAPTAGFDNFYDNFLASHEGGYTASDGNGQPANFGINQGANPDIDVKNLTQDQAKQILKDRYWTASGADKLPPALAAVVGDTAVNMGVGTAKELLAQSGGDPQNMLDLREQRYRDMAAQNPKLAADLPTWLDRNADLGQFIQGSNYANQVATYKAFQQAVQERNQALRTDPVNFVVGARPDIQNQLGSQDPKQVQLGVRSLLQAENDMGIVAPSVLTKGQAAGIIASFNNPQDTNRPADNMNQMLDGLAQQYGSYFPKVMQELQAHGLPPEASALYQVRGMGGPAVRLATAINSMSHMGKDLTSGREAFLSGAPNASQIKQAIPAVMGDYVSSFQGNPQGPQQVQAMTGAVNLYAHQLAYEGMDPNAAAQKAHDDLIGSRYNFVGSYRVPKGIDDSAVSAGANTILGSLTADNVEPYGNAAPGVGVADRRAMAAKVLKSQGMWVTRADDKGLALVWPQSTGYLPALDARGNPITYSWAALSHAGQNKPKSFSEMQLDSAQFGGGQ